MRVPFSWSKDLHLEASTHPIVSSLAGVILERASFTKFFTSCTFSWAKCQALDSWSFLKSEVSFWTTAKKTIAISVVHHLWSSDYVPDTK